jgi:hypothetical protein
MSRYTLPYSGWFVGKKRLSQKRQPFLILTGWFGTWQLFKEGGCGTFYE